METMIVEMQPHRRDTVDPKSDWNGSAIGRFLLPRRAAEPDLMRALYDAAHDYYKLHNRWQKAKDVPGAYREPHGSGAPDATPQDQADIDARIRALGVRLTKIKLAVAVQNRGGFDAIHDAIMTDLDIRPDQHWAATVAIYELARQFGADVPKQSFQQDVGASALTNHKIQNIPCAGN